MPPTFLIRKVGKRISHRIHHFISAKAFGFPKDFSRKALWSGFGVETPTDNAHKKTRRNPRFLICRNVLELRSKPPFLTFLERKVSQRTSPRIHHFILAEAFEVPRNFSRKVSCVRVWGGNPNIQCTQKARQCRAF